MPRIPAVCTNCGTIFNSGINVGTGVGLRFVNVGAGPCPRCNGNGKILDGTYDVLGNTIRVLLASNRSVSELKSLLQALTTANEHKASPETIRDTITAHAPELRAVTDALPANRTELYSFIKMICAALALIIAGYSVLQEKGPSKEEVEAMIDKAVSKTVESPKPKQPSQIAPTPMNRAQRRAGGRPPRRKAPHK